jgi:hypothetical protein
MKQVLLIFLSFLIFFGNIGISVYTHSCSEAGVSKSFFIAQNKCEDSEGSKSCCESEQEETNNCCSDETVIIQVDEKYIQNHGITKVLISEFDIPTIFYHSKNVLLAEIHLSINNWEDPPPKSRKTILIQNQVFRI